jgi:hypothetical protein
VIDFWEGQQIRVYFVPWQDVEDTLVKRGDVGAFAEALRLPQSVGAGQPKPAAGPATRGNLVFVSSSQADRGWLDRIRVHLDPLGVPVWDETQIQPGQERTAELERALDAARVAILLVTADWLASDPIQTEELPPLLTAAESRGLAILSLIVGPSMYLETPSISRFRPMNDPAKPLTSLRKEKQEEVLLQLARTVRAILAG